MENPPSADEVADAWGDEVVEALTKLGLDTDGFERAYDLIVARRLVTLRGFARALGLSLRTARAYLRVLMDFEDVYASAVEGSSGRPELHYCFAPRKLALLCQRRKVSLARFLKLSPVLDRFMVKAEEYYLHRLQEDRTNHVKISKLKREYAARLQPVVSPRTPLKTWTHPVTTHPAWHYVRTAQDLVLMKLDVGRQFVDKMESGDARAIRLPDGRLLPIGPPRIVRLGGRDGKARCACGTELEVGDVSRHLREHQRAVVRAARRSDAWEVVRCKDCGEARVISTKDAFQVKRCVPCQARFRRLNARARRRRSQRLESASPSRRVTSRSEVIITAKAKTGAKGPKGEKVTIKCEGLPAFGDKPAVKCGKERTVNPQDVFQVKRCEEHQKAFRLLRARMRRGKKAKKAPKVAKAPAKKARKPSAQKSEAAPAAAPAEPAPTSG